MRLTRRAERNDPKTLVATFVDAGSLFDLLSSEDHQVLYGRRGTGKTHVLQYLTEMARTRGDIAVYVDMRTVGSSGGLYSDVSIPITERGTRLLSDTLSNVYNVLQSEVLTAAYESDADFSAAMAHLDRLGDSITDVYVAGEQEEEVAAESASSQGDTTSAEVRLDPMLSLAGGISSRSARSTRRSVRRAVRGPMRHRVHFGAISSAVDGVVSSLPGRLWVMLDEWSDVPLDLQPLLADLLRRCLMPVRGVSIKIGAIEQRSNFMEPDGVGGYIGLELGPDISADVDLDDFMVFGNDADKAKAFFRELLFRHVTLEITESGEAPRTADEFVRLAFTQRTAFDEFVRAAEGVPRDAINIAMIAAQHAGNDLISVPIVRSAARRWYLRDKEKAVEANGDATSLLHWIIDEVISGRKARAFLLQQGEETSDDLIGTLYDARVLHVIKRGVSARDQAGVRFNVYALDYGCYVELISTTYAPIGLLPAENEENQPVYVEVPPDDYRSIRRAILDLDGFYGRETPAPLT